jgi:hypothetical protein
MWERSNASASWLAGPGATPESIDAAVERRLEMSRVRT